MISAVHETLYREFSLGGLSYIDAIDKLQKQLGYSAIDAEQIVSEWADGLHENIPRQDRDSHV